MAVPRTSFLTLSLLTRTCWILVSVIAALTEAADLLSRCPAKVPRNSYLRAAEWGKCYQFHMEERTWRNANFICGSMGGHLVTIKEERVQNFLLSALVAYRWPRNGLWIGATDQENEMDWRWITGERVKDGYSKWASGQPSCGIFCFEDCAVMRWRDGGRWHDYRCNWLEDYSFICEYDMEPETTTIAATTTPTTSTTTTTVTTTSTTTTLTTTTTTEAATTKSLQSEYLIHNQEQEERVETNETVAVVPPVIFFQDGNHARVEQVQGHTSSSSHLGSGTLAALIVSLLTAMTVGLCCVIFLLFRRRRRKQLQEQVGISYENPYYGETKAPLTSSGGDALSEEDDAKFGDADDGESFGAYGGSDGVVTGGEVLAWTAVEKSSKLKQPPPASPLNSRPRRVMNTYDTPPSLSTHKPVTMAAVTKGKGAGPNVVVKKTPIKEVTRKRPDTPEEENHYDEIHSQHLSIQSTYDIPRASLSHKDQDEEPAENFYYNDEEENLYESVDNLRAMVEQRRHARTGDGNQNGEDEDRYVPFALDSAHAV